MAGCRVSLKGVGKTYGDFKAVRDVNIEISEGEFLTLLGPSGSGKTTLLMILAGFVLPTSGTVMLDGANITDLPPHKRNVGMVFQSYALFPHMTVYGNVAFPLEARGIAKPEIESRVKRTLSMVKLEGLAHRYPKELSGGQQQRVALARAIVFGPPLLLMDEPLGALDKKLRDQMQIELVNLKNELKRTVVFVTHDQEEALVMSDRIVVMADGAVQQIGTAEELYERPASRFVADFIGVTNLIDARALQREARAIRVRTAGGLSFLAQPRAGEFSETDVSIVLRPEKVRLGDDATAAINKYTGRILRSVYLGDATQVSVELEGGIVLTAKRPNSAGRITYSVGESIAVGWDPDQTWVV